MFPCYRTFGFVFKKTDTGEADRIFSVFSKDFGRIEILAKGIRKISAKLKSQIEIFSISEIEFVQGKYHKVLIGALQTERFKKIRKDLKKLNFAFKISQILDSLLKGQEREERIYNLLSEIFFSLSRTKKEEIVFLAFFWRLISILGYSLNLDFCQICQRKPKKFFIDFEVGGLICENCKKNAKMIKEIDSSGIKFLKLLQREKIDFLERLKIGKETLKEILSLSLDYFQFLAEKNENQIF